MRLFTHPGTGLVGCLVLSQKQIENFILSDILENFAGKHSWREHLFLLTL